MTSGMPRYMFFQDRLVPHDDARVHVLSTAVKYGAVVYEGIRGYWSEEADELFLFRAEDHFRRLLRSMKIASVQGPVDLTYYLDNLTMLVRANKLRETLHIRVQVLVEAPDGGLGSTEPVTVAMATIPKAGILSTRGLSVQVSSWTRISDRSMPPRVKAAANYHNSRLALLQATADGYDDAILLTAEGRVSEGPGYTLFAVRDGVLMTPPVTDSILEGITRDTVIRLARDDLGVHVVERSMDRTELYCVDELFFCGSGAEVAPITSVDRRPVGDGRPGTVTELVRRAYFAYAHGSGGDPYAWLTPVYGSGSTPMTREPDEAVAGNPTSDAF